MAKKLKHSPQTIDKAIDFYVSGNSFIDLEKEFGIPYESIRYHMVKRGIERRSKNKPHANLTEKTCAKCLELRPIKDFHFSRMSQITGRPIYGYCKPCSSMASLVSRNPVKVKENRMLRQYGLHPEDYTRMTVEQKGVCYICESKTTYALYVDHDHATGKVRKLLCQKCNSCLGFMNDNINLAKRFTKYLEEHKDK